MKASTILHPICALQHHWIVNTISAFVQRTKEVMIETVNKLTNGYECASKLMHEKYQIEHKTEAVGSAKIWCVLLAIWLMVKSLIKTIQLEYFSSSSFESNSNDSKGQHELTYSHQNKVYKILVSNPIVCSHIKQCVSAKATIKVSENIKEEDVTEQCVKLLGPYENWHHQSYTPATFGWESLTIYKLCDETFDTIEHTFQANDKLIKVSEIKSTSSS